MARFFPVRSQCQFDTAGERRFAERLERLHSGRDAGGDGVPIIVPESAGRRGAFPELIHCDGHWQEWDCLVTRIRDEQANGRILNDMAIIYPNNAQAEAAERALTQAGIAYASGTSSKAAANSTAAKTASRSSACTPAKACSLGWC